MNLVFAVFDVFAFEDRMRKTSKVFILYNWLLMFLFKEQNNGFFLFLFFSKVTVSKLEKKLENSSRRRTFDRRIVTNCWQTS